MTVLLQFIYLQVLDILTTVAVLQRGGFEGNPLISGSMAIFSPIMSLVVFKILALALAAYCWRAGRPKLVVKANVFYAVVVAWNVFMTVAGSAKLV